MRRKASAPSETRTSTELLNGVCFSLMDINGTILSKFLKNHSSSPSNVKELAERTLEAYLNVGRGFEQLMGKYTVKACGYCSEVHVGPWGHNVKLCGAFKHQWRDGKHGWQDARIQTQEFHYGRAPAFVELCVQAGAEIPDEYRPMMRTGIVIPDAEEAWMVA